MGGFSPDLHHEFVIGTNEGVMSFYDLDLTFKEEGGEIRFFIKLTPLCHIYEPVVRYSPSFGRFECKRVKD